MLEYKIETQKERATVHFTGKITDDVGTPLSRLAFELKDATHIYFNFRNVRNLDSLGIRRWVLFLREVEQHAELFFEECTPEIVDQINVTPALLGQAFVSSFFTNYLCQGCSASSVTLTETKTLAKGAYPTPPTCSTCKTAMETEELESEYFQFLDRLQS